MHSAAIPAYASAKEGAKEFLKFMATDEGIEIYLNNSLNSTLPFDYDITQWDGYEEMSAIGKRKFEIFEQAIFVPFAHQYKTAYAGGLGAYRITNISFEAAFAAPNKNDRQTADEIINDNIEYWNDTRWNNMLKQAGLG